MPDSLVPAFITVDPATGAIGADFTGHVHAEGLDLDLGQSDTPPDEDRLRWLSTLSPAPAQPIGVEALGYESADGRSLQLIARPPGGSNPSRLYLAGIDANPTDSGVIVSLAPPPGIPLEAVVFNGDGASTFLQNSHSAAGGSRDLGPAVRVHSIGVKTLHWAASVDSALVNVTHDLYDRAAAQVTPRVVLAQADNRLVSVGVSAFTNTQFSLRGHRIDGAVVTEDHDVYWIAIGP